MDHTERILVRYSKVYSFEGSLVQHHIVNSVSTLILNLILVCNLIRDLNPVSQICY